METEPAYVSSTFVNLLAVRSINSFPFSIGMYIYAAISIVLTLQQNVGIYKRKFYHTQPFISYIQWRHLAHKIQQKPDV
jgi:hypothetical protein